MTEKLFYQDSYLTEFEATVIECEKIDEGIYRILLDRTAFFPMEGGQTPDRGYLNDAEIVDVQIKNDDIYHFSNTSFNSGEKVLGKIDWKHRFTNMQMHTGEHIFSGFVNKLFGFNNVGFHLSDNSATMDYDGKLSEEDVKKLERLANGAIWEAHEVKTFFPDSNELDKLDFRSKSGISGAVRIVEIDNVDICACCAPHVRNTSEVGILKIVSFENYKGGTRFNYLCGSRAFDDYVRLCDNEMLLSRTLNSKKDDLINSISKLKEDNETLKFSMTSLRREKISSLCRDSKDGIVFLGIGDSDQMRFAAGELELSGRNSSLVFAGNDENGYRFIIESKAVDFSNLFDELRNCHGAKGGGKKGSYQGSVNITLNELTAVLKKYVSGEN